MQKILTKTLVQVTPRLQCLLKRNLLHDFSGKFIKGSTKQLAEYFSRLGALDHRITFLIAQANEITSWFQATAMGSTCLHESTVQDDDLFNLLKHLEYPDKSTMLVEGILHVSHGTLRVSCSHIIQCMRWSRPSSRTHQLSLSSLLSSSCQPSAGHIGCSSASSFGSSISSLFSLGSHHNTWLASLEDGSHTTWHATFTICILHWTLEVVLTTDGLLHQKRSHST